MAEIIKLKKEYNFGGKKITEISLDIDELSGTDFEIAEKEYLKRNKGTSVKELEDGWALTVAAKASGLKYGDLLKLKGKDYLSVLYATKGFLNSVWGTEEKGTTKEEITIEE